MLGGLGSQLGALQLAAAFSTVITPPALLPEEIIETTVSYTEIDRTVRHDEMDRTVRWAG